MQKAPTTTLHAVVPAKEIEDMTHTSAGGGAKGRKKKNGNHHLQGCPKTILRVHIDSM